MSEDLFNYYDTLRECGILSAAGAAMCNDFAFSAEQRSKAETIYQELKPKDLTDPRYDPRQQLEGGQKIFVDALEGIARDFLTLTKMENEGAVPSKSLASLAKLKKQVDDLADSLHGLSPAI